MWNNILFYELFTFHYYYSMQRIKKGDKVIVTAGKFKKTITEITAVDGDKLFLKDVNIMKKAKKWKGFIDVHHPIHTSNVAIVDPQTNTPTRISFQMQKNKKVRVTQKSQSVLA